MILTSIKKALKSMLLLALFSICVTIVNAQSENLDTNSETVLESDSLTILETYEQTQNQQREITSPGTATYNIVEDNEQGSSGASERRSDSNVEELRVYSGSQHGNNVIKTIEVEIPQK